MYSQADEEYLESEVLTAAPEKLHLLVVDAAIKFALRAEEALQQKDFETSFAALNQSRGFVAELIGGVRADHDEELAGRIKSLFVYIYRQLAEADVDHDVQKVADSIDLLRRHRETWAELTDLIASEQSESHSSQIPRPKSLDLTSEGGDDDYQPRSWTT